ncbi:SpaH/EbpB family LPXTG-anchored major pilin [Pseudoflavonifractor phocaeensis]|uniref:SpaH/EbpB family LPXTG-anchored major pilin n=1 Tax=Pseudoflavonifractor phocaeensis TaxID=1870988 RepID=UPI001F481DE2|nr:SpaH/EbpB family LPXTG-anchored major pilin [Pseudoflavonifractor phocaeensis]MCF2596772.1 SpaH/EbpB family LPXTG-anchored major pilin [Pseudoflavonifractor phocaeensis]
MKRTKKLFSLALAFIMAMALMTPAFAAQEGTLTGGSITINDAVPGQTYNAYQILYLESYNADSNAYAYKANSAWETWLKTQTSYVSFDAQGYVTWKDGADAAAFAKLAQVEAAKMTADATATAPAAADGKTYSTVTFNNLKLGYYLVDTTLGTLCSLDTTNPDVVMEEKNEVPTNVKTVEEDSTGIYGEKNDADIGQTVNFKSTITAQAGAENYVFHDKMSAGLTYTGVTGITLNGTTVDASNYTVTAPAADGDTFDVTFTQAFCDTLKANDQIVISYTATLNENAVIAGEGNPNTSKVSYGDSSNTKYTPDSQTKTYTWKVDVFKYTMDGETEKALAGAKFTLSKNADGSNPIALVSEGNNVYRVAKTGETGTVTEITTDATGKFTIQGLDADTYYLTETKAPDGYNKLAGPITIVIGENGVVNGTTEAPLGVDEVKVLNQTGAELPSTGGMGTTIFYVLGGVLMAGAAILLVTKKKMSNEQ